MKLLSCIVLAGCMGPIEKAPARPEPQGWAGHMAAADEHDAKADEHHAHIVEASKASDTWTCGWDPNLDDVATSGGERLSPTTPCWNVTQQQADTEKRKEKDEREQAHTDRAVAANLVEAEVEHCSKLPQQDRMRSPFAHARLIAKVVPKTEHGAVRGAYVVFENARELTVERMRAALACNHSAYATLGRPADFAPYDPTLIEGVTVTVDRTTDGHVRVLIESPDTTDGQIILDRAKQLLAGKSASR
jgi:hypothetical protein